MIHYTKQERVEAVRRKMKELCPVCWQDTVILVVVMTIALDMGLLLQPVGADDSHAALIFVAGGLPVHKRLPLWDRCQPDGGDRGKLCVFIPLLSV